MPSIGICVRPPTIPGYLDVCRQRRHFTNMIAAFLGSATGAFQWAFGLLQKTANLFAPGLRSGTGKG